MKRLHFRHNAVLGKMVADPEFCEAMAGSSFRSRLSKHFDLDNHAIIERWEPRVGRMTVYWKSPDFDRRASYTEAEALAHAVELMRIGRETGNWSHIALIHS